MLRRQLWRTCFWFYLIYYEYFIIKVKINWQGLLLLFKMEFQQLHSTLKQKYEQNIWSSGFKILDIMQSMTSSPERGNQWDKHCNCPLAPPYGGIPGHSGRWQVEAGRLPELEEMELRVQADFEAKSLQDKMLEKRKLQRDQL